MRKTDQINPTVIRLGGLCFFTLALMALIFYQQRSTMMDAAYQVFQIIVQERPAIQVNRFGAIFTQIFPLFSVELGLSLQVVLISYSLAFVIYPTILFRIILRWIKQPTWALTLPLFYVLMVSHTFYWIQSELIQGLAFLLFYFACLEKDSVLKLQSLPLHFAALVLLVFFHPLLFIPLLYLWLFRLHGGFLKQWVYFTIPVFTLLILGFKHFWLGPNAYDSIAISRSQSLFENSGEFFSFISTRRFFIWCFRDYYFFPILFFYLVYFYGKNREFTKMGLLVLFTLAYIFLVNSTFRWGLPQFHMESFYQILAVFVLVPFVMDILPGWEKNQQVGLIALVFCIRLLHIGLQHQPYTQRLDWNENLIERTAQWEEQKFLTFEKDVPMEKLKMTWASPYETLLLSALPHPDSSKTIMIANPELVPVDEYLKEKSTLLTPFGLIPLSELPKQYFRLRDNSVYTVLKKENLPE